MSRKYESATKRKLPEEIPVGSWEAKLPVSKAGTITVGQALTSARQEADNTLVERRENRKTQEYRAKRAKYARERRAKIKAKKEN